MDGVEFFKDTTKKLANVYKLFELFDDAPEKVWYTTGKTFEHQEGVITLDKISFSYDDGQQIFTDFSLHIKPMSKTALVGNSGA